MSAVTVGREGRHVVDHVATRASSTTPRCAKLCARARRRRAPRGHEVVLVCSGAIAAGLPALGLADAPDRHRHAAGDRRRRPAPAHGAARRASSAEHGLVAGQVLLTPHDFGAPHRSTCTRARPCAACSTSAWCRSSTRTTPSPTTRSATATTTASPRSSSHLVARRRARAAHRHRRAVHRRSAARRRTRR